MVLFVSECEKNSIKKTCRVLDAFANRVGQRTWRTFITMEGLSAVKKLLKKTASRNTAIACHWIRRRNQSELLWTIGNKDKFNSQGEIPVNFTEKEIINTKWENDWIYLPLIKALTAMSALFHDWGKSSKHFQNKLKNNNEIDPIRHEWISYILLNAFVQTSKNNTSDEPWLMNLIDGKIDKEKIINFLKNYNYIQDTILPPAATLISWLIITHHKLPSLELKKAKDYREDNSIKSINDFFQIISKKWGYENSTESFKLEFPEGFLEKSHHWRRTLQKWASKTKDCLPLLQKCMSDGAWLIILHHARLSLMLGDHFFSSEPADLKWETNSQLYANTEKYQLKQKLDEHLVGVTKEALRISHSLPRMESQLPFLDLDNTHKLNKNSPKNFKWQDNVISDINDWKKETEILTKEKQYGFFGINMASTGTGKTFANAKIMASLSENKLRYTLALGLRTLTLQTGDEYRNRINIDKRTTAVQIGSKAVMELHEKNLHINKKEQIEELVKQGSESLENLLEEDIDYDDHNELEKTALSIALKDKKHKHFLYSPILICTIDMIMSAVETKRGGRYILPFLRLMSSDLVIDEIDDFNPKDLIPIGRLIFLTGMLGRKILIASATIPPDLAEGYFNAYQKGWSLFCKTRSVKKAIGCAWIDEFRSKIENIQSGKNKTIEMYKEHHKKFVGKRVLNLKMKPARRKGEIIRCEEIKISSENQSSKSNREKYFEIIKNTIITMHERHKLQDTESQKLISIGLVRTANINPCIDLSKYLLNTNYTENTDVKIMTYHSRQIMLLRSKQEAYLDSILKKKEESLNDTVIRKHIQNTKAKNIIFIVVSTPVEEVGRDHDFDWAVVEPSSFRSIIQLAGRVKRHRLDAVQFANVGLMQYNLQSIENNSQPAYCKPGYESKEFRLETHDLTKLLNENEISNKIDASPRIYKPQKLINEKQSLANLEHKVINALLTDYSQKGPESLQGYLEHYWNLTALPQVLRPFRDQQSNIILYLVCDGDGFYFAEKKDKRGQPIKRNDIHKIEYKPNLDSSIRKDRLWLNRNYKECLKSMLSETQDTIKSVSLRYGELNIPIRDIDRDKKYLDQFGLVYYD